jgi:nucleoside-diphosphate-sugar epimerase
MKILFTGGTGVLGAEALPRLLERGDDVTVVTRSEAEAELVGQQGARGLSIDLLDRDAVVDSVHGFDTIIHFATAIPPQSAMSKRQAWIMNDRLRSEATSYLVDAAIATGVQRFIQQSVTFTYAEGGSDWLDEGSPIKPVWDVLDSALDAERHVDRFRQDGGTGVVLRLARVYGPGRASDEYLESVRSRKLPIVGDGQNFVSSLHTHDAGVAIAAALTAPGGTYNVTDDEPQSSRSIVELIASELRVRSPRKVPEWLGHVAVGKATGLLTISHRVSNTCFKDATGWQPEYRSASEGWTEIARSR